MIPHRNAIANIQTRFVIRKDETGKMLFIIIISSDFRQQNRIFYSADVHFSIYRRLYYVVVSRRVGKNAISSNHTNILHFDIVFFFFFPMFNVLYANTTIYSYRSFVDPIENRIFLSILSGICDLLVNKILFATFSQPSIRGSL